MTLRAIKIVISIAPGTTYKAGRTLYAPIAFEKQYASARSVQTMALTVIRCGSGLVRPVSITGLLPLLSRGRKGRFFIMYAVVADDSIARKQRSRSYNVGDSDNMGGMKATTEIKGIAVKIIL